MTVVPAGVRARAWGWRHAGRRRWAVQGLDLDIAPGERVLLLGASGAGKSTLLRALAGVLGDAEDGEAAGELLVDGAPPQRARGRAGLVLQDPDAQVVLARAGDDIAFACENLGVPREELWARVDEARAAVGLAVARDHPTARLSGGQKQRLALAGVVAMRPGLVLLDEPTANVDPAGAVEVRDAVVRACAASGATLVVVEHRVALWADGVDRVIVLSPEAAGGVLADGDPATVFAREGEALAAAGVWVPGRDIALARGPAGSGETLLRAEGLAVGRRRLGARTADAVASGVDIELRAGRTLAITGPNGAGKSTLALTLAGLLPPAGGRVRAAPALAGGLGPEPSRWRARDLLTRIGMVFQEPEHQLLTARVRDELAVGPRALGQHPHAVGRRVDELLERLRLTRLADVNPFTLSGGEKRRLTVAAMLASAPRALVLDEPTFGQDAVTWREIAELIEDVRARGAAVAVVTHDDALVEALADDLSALPAPRGRTDEVRA
ncbi:ATP-binding cassette domain-containing protein [Microbacterium sp. 10M-3C3]|uniref:ABC transporter ATP-binding protein n=1 Tax=Microbacterium sp. 10M-3C3 TaxID=2483401 RepID=UPI001F0CCBEF|nr:ATP-binding cassette domain-containing protein [Microbacterium sp. 10M-3C3]